MTEKLHSLLHYGLTLELEKCAKKGGTDKQINDNFYTPHYEIYFEKIRHENLKIIEFGVGKGQSIKMLELYFPNSMIYGVDKAKCSKTFGDNVSILNGDLDNNNFIEKVILETGGEFDIIIEDAEHHMYQQQQLFKTFFKHVKDGGIYIIEDLGTSYFSHRFLGGYKKEGTTIEFLKEKIDCVNVPFFKRTNIDYKIEPYVLDFIEEPLSFDEENIYSMHFYKGLCLIFKGKQCT